MDFRKLSRALSEPPSPGGNNTSTTPGLELPPNILEALIPGYSIISRYASAYLGIDISMFVTIGLAILAINKGGMYIWGQLLDFFRSTVMSSVFIDEHDDLFDMLMSWLAANQASTSRSRDMRAKTQRGTDDFEETADEDALDANGLFNFTNWSARIPPRYEPYYGSQYIWFQGRLFWFRRSRQPSNGGRIQVSFSNTQQDDIIQLDCLGRSVEPIKGLIKAIRTWSLNRTRHTTTIRHPTPKERARWGGAWSKTSSRPSRPMDTVILDTEQKNMIVKDMNEYLHPASPKWYATRGIPYRRGYLFHGPPGTGKTSLSFALAGIFGLDIYAITLQEPSLTEGDLMQLFNGLPRRCIVLLEDVDAAGLLRDGNSDSMSKGKRLKKEKKDGDESKNETNSGNQGKKSDTTSTKPKKEEEYTLKDLARELKTISNPPRSRGSRSNDDNTHNGTNPNRIPGQRISLSGLLNAIDGVATHEGRVLIMTTNHPEKLDAALIRPGRVDRKVEFKLAMREQIRELFVRMYAASDMIPKAEPLSNGTAKHAAANGHASAPDTKTKPDEDEISTLSRSDIEALAAQFAARVPDDMFTPAEIQNLLMRHKKSPSAALGRVEAWMKEILEEKEKEAKAKAEEETDDDE
ncbi:Hypothetical protein R9X50_00114300 [Acrodontium crateriforme]|uniref:P-loop containing nucleoside triphosphate hydrolase protein n=1 Tax=Acrodontium crateriforme TaxID=150365 RepID=A0AAQ3M069_9PEZI|nr:Hypothetical protein R9X50_00114300 [Acrodontium crateriforme]